MCRMRAWSCWDGDCTACQKFASFPPQCVTTLFGSSPPTTLILNSPSLKSLVKEGGTLLLLLLVLLLVLLRVVPPATFWTPGPLDDKNLCWVIFSHCHFLRWLVLYMRRRLPWVSHMIHPHHGTAPSCFCIVQNTTRTRIPSWSIAGTSYFQNRFFTSGWPLPVVSLRSL